jgi:glucan phosphoethanolaminetransferase (alkaline phosphatase superfamily)
MDKLKATHKWFIFMMPLVIAMSSFVMGYFMVYLTMMEDYLQRLHQYTQDESELYFTLAMSLLPLGAFAGTSPLTQPPSSTASSWKSTARIKSCG